MHLNSNFFDMKLQTKKGAALGLLYSPHKKDLYLNFEKDLEQLNYRLLYFPDWEELLDPSNILPLLLFADIDLFTNIDTKVWQSIEEYLVQQNLYIIVTGSFYSGCTQHIFNIHTNQIVDVFFMPVHENHLELLVQRYYPRSNSKQL